MQIGNFRRGLGFQPIAGERIGLPRFFHIPYNPRDRQNLP